MSILIRYDDVFYDDVEGKFVSIMLFYFFKCFFIDEGRFVKKKNFFKKVIKVFFCFVRLNFGKVLG